MVGSLADFIYAGKNQIFAVNSMQWAKFLQYRRASTHFTAATSRPFLIPTLREEVVALHLEPLPFRQALRSSTECRGLSARTTPRTPVFMQVADFIKRCCPRCRRVRFAELLDGRCTTKICIVNNPVDYLSNAAIVVLSTRNRGGGSEFATCHISTGTGPMGEYGPTYRLSVIRSRPGLSAIARQLGTVMAGHDLPIEAPDASSASRSFGLSPSFRVGLERTSSCEADDDLSWVVSFSMTWSSSSRLPHFSGETSTWVVIFPVGWVWLP